MERDEQARIIGANITRMLNERNEQQVEFAKAIGENPTTVNMWCSGKSIPRFSKLEKIANHFHCLKSDITDIKAEYSDRSARITAAILQDREILDALERLLALSIEDRRTVMNMISFLAQKKD